METNLIKANNEFFELLFPYFIAMHRKPDDSHDYGMSPIMHQPHWKCTLEMRLPPNLEINRELGLEFFSDMTIHGERNKPMKFHGTFKSEAVFNEICIMWYEFMAKRGIHLDAWEWAADCPAAFSFEFEVEWADKTNSVKSLSNGGNKELPSSTNQRRKKSK